MSSSNTEPEAFLLYFLVVKMWLVPAYRNSYVLCVLTLATAEFHTARTALGIRGWKRDKPYGAKYLRGRWWSLKGRNVRTCIECRIGRISKKNKIQGRRTCAYICISGTYFIDEPERARTRTHIHKSLYCIPVQWTGHENFLEYASVRRPTVKCDVVVLRALVL